MTKRLTRIEFLFFSDENIFTVDPVFNKQNDRVVTFGNDVSKHRRVSSIKYPASIMMLGFLALNGEKMTPVWLERGYRLTSGIYREVLKRKVIPRIKQITKKSSNRTERRHTWQRTVQDRLDRSMRLWLKDFWPPHSVYLNPLDFSLWTHIEEKIARHATAQGICKPRMAVND